MFCSIGMPLSFECVQETECLYWCFTRGWSMLTWGSSTIFKGCAGVILLALVNYTGLVDLKYMHGFWVRRQKWIFISIFSSSFMVIPAVVINFSTSIWFHGYFFMFIFYSCWWRCCHLWVLCIMWYCFCFFICRDTFVKEMNKESKNDRNDRGLFFAWLQNSENLWYVPRL